MSKNKSSPKRMTLLAVQSIVCGIVLLLALVLRLLGGTVYDKTRELLYDALIDSGVMETVSVWLSEKHV